MDELPGNSLAVTVGAENILAAAVVTGVPTAESAEPLEDAKRDPDDCLGTEVVDVPKSLEGACVAVEMDELPEKNPVPTVGAEKILVVAVFDATDTAGALDDAKSPPEECLGTEGTGLDSAVEFAHLNMLSFEVESVT